MSKTYVEGEEVMHHAIELILDLEHMYDDGKIDEGTFAYLVSEVNKFNFFTPADVKPVVRGEWICTDDDRNIWMCSVCIEEQILEAGTPRDNDMHFCPNCGCEMREGGTG